MNYVKEHFDMLCEIGQMIAAQFGEHCEVVLHDLTRPYDNTIVAIWNGHVTGRCVGGGGTNAGLALLRKKEIPKDEYCYINHTPDGKILKSSSKYFVVKGKIVGSLCINLDITDIVAAQRSLEEIGMPKDSGPAKREVFANNVDELLDTMIQDELLQLEKTVEELTKEEKIMIVHNLDKRGAFLIKKAAERVAEFFGISRFTVYNYLNAASEGKNEQTTD